MRDYSAWRVYDEHGAYERVVPLMLNVLIFEEVAARANIRPKPVVAVLEGAVQLRFQHSAFERKSAAMKRFDLKTKIQQVLQVSDRGLVQTRDGRLTASIPLICPTSDFYVKAPPTAPGEPDVCNAGPQNGFYPAKQNGQQLRKLLIRVNFAV